MKHTNTKLNTFSYESTNTPNTSRHAYNNANQRNPIKYNNFTSQNQAQNLSNSYRQNSYQNQGSYSQNYNQQDNNSNTFNSNTFAHRSLGPQPQPTPMDISSGNSRNTQRTSTRQTNFSNLANRAPPPNRNYIIREVHNVNDTPIYNQNPYQTPNDFLQLDQFLPQGNDELNELIDAVHEVDDQNFQEPASENRSDL